MENEIKKILVSEQTPMAIVKINEIINQEKAKTRTWQMALVLFIIVFVGWYCLHVSINHNIPSEKINKDSIIYYQKTVIGIQKQALDSAIYIKHL